MNQYLSEYISVEICCKKFREQILHFFAFIISFYSSNIYAQSYHYKNYTVKGGLISSETYHAYQDSKGFIWIATDDGISRFDGTKFKNYTKEEGLPDNTVFEFFEDYKNRLWIVPYSVNLSYLENDTLKHFKYNDVIQDVLESDGNPVKLSFFIDTNDNIYFRDTKKGSFIIDKYGRVQKFRNNKNYIEFYIKNNSVLIGNQYSDFKTSSFYKFHL